MYIHTYIHTYIHFVCVCIGEASFNRWLQRRTGSTRSVFDARAPQGAWPPQS